MPVNNNQPHKIYVIIVTYNPVPWLNRCLDGLKSSIIPLNIIVVDNGSDDEGVEIIKKNYPEVTLIENKANLGFGKANNIGVEKALSEGADYLFLLNQDAWIEPDTISKLVQAHEHFPEYGVISPLHLNGTGDKLDYYFSTYIVPEKCPDLIADFLGSRHFKKSIYDIEFVNAAAWLIPAQCWKDVGEFSPLFYHYGEDVDFINRARHKNYKIGCVPNAVIYHDRKGRNLSPPMFTQKHFEMEERSYVTQLANPALKNKRSWLLIKFAELSSRATFCMVTFQFDRMKGFAKLCGLLLKAYVKVNKWQRK